MAFAPGGPRAVSEASDAPKAPLAGALGRLRYLVHLALLLWWLLDRSPNQLRRVVLSLDELDRDAPLGGAAAS